MEKKPGSHGLSGETIRDFKDSLVPNLRKIREQLRTRSYKFSPLRAAPITKRSVGEFRPLRIPEVRDRVVCKAIALLIQPILVRKLGLNNAASYAYQKGLGPREAIERMVALYRQGRPFIWVADIVKFFDTVDKELLLSQYVFPHLPDDSLNDLIREALAMEIGNRDQLSGPELMSFVSSEGGIPQGSSLSPLLSNAYLAEFDQQMIARGYGLVRYADDFIVVCSSKREAEDAHQFARTILEEQLHLRLHPLDHHDANAKSEITQPTQKPIEFLSICFSGSRIWPSRSTVVALKAQLREVTEPKKHVDVLTLLWTTRNLLQGWIAAFYYTDIEPILTEIDALANRRICRALYRMGWELDKQFLKRGPDAYELSDAQRSSSGIPWSTRVLKELRDAHGSIELNSPALLDSAPLARE